MSPSPEAELADAIAKDELVLHYQPIVDLRTGAVDAWEALVRWHRPGGPLRPPGDFIPLAEQSDLICSIDTWVLHAAARQVAVWNRTIAGQRVAVNVSGGHINHERIVDDVTAALCAHEIDPGQLVLEITETVAVDGGEALDNLSELRRRGVALSLDDVGVGHNSLDLVSRLPLHSVKLDRTFLDPATASARTALQKMVRAAHSLDLAVIGEGVERPDQLTLLRDLGVDLVQGFLIGRPLPPEELRGQVGRRHSSPDW